MTVNYFTEFVYLISISILFIYVFLVFTFFLLLNTYDIRFIKNLSDLKKFGLTFPFNLMFLITIMSFAGIPPLFGFSIKLILFLLLINGASLFFVGLLALFNFFTLYFYIQNVRYVVNNSKNTFYIYTNNFVYISDCVMFFLLASLLVNLSGILYLSDILIIFANFSI